MQIQISWLLQKPTDLDLHCLQRQDIAGFSRIRVNVKLCLFCLLFKLVASFVDKVLEGNTFSVGSKINLKLTSY